MDCFFIGRLSGTKGSVWQYTAIDVASSYTWAELHTSQRNPRSQHCQKLLHRLAHELALAGWKLQTVTTDNGSEFTNQDFRKVVEAAGGKQRRIKAGRPTSNGCVERVQLTLEKRRAQRREVVPAVVEVCGGGPPARPRLMGAFGWIRPKIYEGGPPDEQATGCRGRLGRGGVWGAAA
jgi:transposase InsO family protein